MVALGPLRTEITVGKDEEQSCRRGVAGQVTRLVPHGSGGAYRRAGRLLQAIVASGYGGVDSRVRDGPPRGPSEFSCGGAGAGAGQAPPASRSWSEPQPGADRHHRRSPRTDRRDDLLRVDPLTCRRAKRLMRQYRAPIYPTFTIPVGFYCYRVSGGSLGGQWRCVKGSSAFRFDFGD